MLSFKTSFNKILTASLFRFNPARLHRSDRTVITFVNYRQLSRYTMSTIIDPSTTVILITL